MELSIRDLKSDTRVATTCAGNAATQVWTANWKDRQSALIHNSSPTYNLWVRMVRSGASAPTISEADKDFSVPPGGSMLLPASAGVDVYVMNSSGAATTSNFTATETDCVVGGPTIAGSSVTVSGSVTPGTGATDLGKAEDAAHTSGHTGVMMLAVRSDVAAALAGADGDYIPFIVDANGRLHVLDQNSAAALTALQLLDDVVKTDDAAFTPATDKVAMIGAEFDDTTPDSVDEGDAGALRMSARRELYSQVRDAAGNERGANVNASNELTVADATLRGAVKVDDAVFTPATDPVVMIGAQADETSADSVNEGDAGALRMTLERMLRVVTQPDSKYINWNGAQVEVQRAVINTASSGVQTLVAGTASKQKLVLAMILVANGAIDVFVRDGTGVALIGGSTGPLDLQQSTGFVLPFNPVGWALGASAAALQLNMGAAVGVGGCVIYADV